MSRNPRRDLRDILTHYVKLLTDKREFGSQN